MTSPAQTHTRILQRELLALIQGNEANVEQKLKAASMLLKAKQAKPVSRKQSKRIPVPLGTR